MGVPDLDSVYCRNLSCDIFNVDGYCPECLIEFFNFLIKEKKIKELKEDEWQEFEALWKEFEQYYAKKRGLE